MHILLLGKVGQLGWELQRTLACLGQVTCYDYPEIDLGRLEMLAPLIGQVKPQVVINATAYTAVDQAESEPELAMRINADAPGVLAEAARLFNAVFIHFSTDYVFDGTKNRPYREVDDPNPLGEYGRSKLAGEQAIQQAGSAYLILRTSWLYSTRRDSFVTKVLEWAGKSDTLRVVTDQISNPTWARMLAEVTAQLLLRAKVQAGDDLHDWFNGRQGVYHLAGDGYTSRFEWAQAILEHISHMAGLDNSRRIPEVLPALTSDFPTLAMRPLFSALDCQLFKQTFDLVLPPWEKALQLALDDMFTKSSVIK